ncbi:class I glutamine amidotransferase-like protein [Phlebopus sp. FC_14]|nr:class I glutamine amidotransferase-like protein [Phlebopus sp. FC_14]
MVPLQPVCMQSICLRLRTAACHKRGVANLSSRALADVRSVLHLSANHTLTARRRFSSQAFKMAKRALILIADGTEEMEFTITYDTLARAGIECTSANVQTGGSPYGSVGTSPALVVCSRGVKILPDTNLNAVQAGPHNLSYDTLVIPGGLTGAKTISESSEVQNLIKQYYNDPNKIVAMICAGPCSAITTGLPHQPITSHPVIEDELKKNFDYKEETVVVSDKVEGKATLVTSRGPGTAFPFAFKLVELLCGKAKSDEIRGPMMFPPSIPYPPLC